MALALDCWLVLVDSALDCWSVMAGPGLRPRVDHWQLRLLGPERDLQSVLGQATGTGQKLQLIDEAKLVVSARDLQSE